MRQALEVIVISLLVLSSCTSTEKLSYLNNLPETTETQYFPVDVPDYKIQFRDILYITAKAMNPDGEIVDLLQGEGYGSQMRLTGGEQSHYILGYNVDKGGYIFMPIIGKVDVAGHSLEEIRILLQKEVDKFFNNTYVECKLLSFKFTVLGEANSPGTYLNYNNYLTVLEAVGRAGGVGDFGRRDRVLVLRSTEDGSKTYRINLQDKNLLTSEAYFMQPNDIVIIEPVGHKIFNMNLPTISFALTTISSLITTTLLLINFFGNN
ncbi:MAG: polysaccharide biosynthesis/export family protein [Bacteroidales bacterium]|nr:polysaccharide biosynthesis/export family protein [Bacteroidales bacterium]